MITKMTPNVKSSTHDRDALCELIVMCASAQAWEVLKKLPERNRVAQQIFHMKNGVHRSVNFGKYTVRTWWDYQSRNYITMTLDEKGHDLAMGRDNAYTGNSDDASVAHLWALNYLFNTENHK